MQSAGIVIHGRLDVWHAESFDPTDLADLFRRAGAAVVVPTTKHHDGITLWDAPGTGDRNTVRRGPRRDLVGDLASAVRAAGLRFGVYYSGGLDWHFAPLDPITDEVEDESQRRNDADYAEYCYHQLLDLIERYSPDVLWGDIEYPDPGKGDGPYSFANLLDRFYAAALDGVVNDRWGLTRRAGAIRHLLDMVSRGGTFLLNGGPDAAGKIPDLQRQCLEGMAAWMRTVTCCFLAMQGD